jgi:hypothetical protein
MATLKISVSDPARLEVRATVVKLNVQVGGSGAGKELHAILKVDATYGSDARAAADRNFPFRSITAAKAAAASGDTIVIFPGTYNEYNLAKDGVTMHFLPGAKVRYTGSVAGACIFSDNNVATEFYVTGKGQFWNMGTGGSNDCIRTQAIGTKFYIECDELYAATNRAVSNYESLVEVTARRIQASDGAIDIVGTSNGNAVTRIKAGTITSFNNYVLEFDGGTMEVEADELVAEHEDFAAITTSSGTGSMRVRAKRIIAAGYGVEALGDGKVYIDGANFQCGIADIAESSAGVIYATGCTSGLNFSALTGDFSKIIHIATPFATNDETVAGLILNKAVHPAGVKALLDSYNVEASAAAAAASAVNAANSATQAQSTLITAGTTAQEAMAIEILRAHNPDYVFSGFVNTSTPTPTKALNKAYIATVTGTIFGISVTKGQVIWDNGVAFKAENIVPLFEAQKNKYNPNLAVDSSFLNNADGAFAQGAPYAAYCSTGKIPVSPSTAYSIWKIGATFGYLHFYDAAGAWIGNNTTVAGTTGITGGYSFTTPANCYYVATWGVKGAEAFDTWRNLVMLELGAKTTYEAYSLKIRESILKAIYNKTESDALILAAKNEAISTAQAAAQSYCDSEIIEAKVFLPNNLVVGEGTQTPTVLVIGNGANLSISAVANDVIFPTEYAYKRRYSSPAASGVSFIAWNLNYPATKPGIISFAYWVKDSDIDTVYAGKGSQQNLWLYDTGTAAIHVLYFDNIAAKAAVGTTTSGTFNYTGKVSGKWRVVCIGKENGYSRMAISWFDLVYDPSYTKTGFTLYHIFNGVPERLNTQSIDFVGFTLIMGEHIVYPSVYPDAGGKDQYPPSSLSLDSKIDTKVAALQAGIDSNTSGISTLNSRINGVLKVLKAGNYLYVRSPFSSTKDLVKRFLGFAESTSFYNDITSLPTEFLIDKAAADTEAAYTAGIALNSPGDDATPNNYNGTYIGGNHGNSNARQITVNSHGKAAVDIGSAWTDGSGRKYYIIRIFDANKLWVLSENIGTPDIFIFDTSISGTTLTHFSGATNTATMTISADEMVQINPATRNASFAILLDGVTPVSTDGLYYANFVDVVNQYDIVNTASMLTNLIAAVGTNYSTAQLVAAFRNGSPSVFNQILYRVQKNGAMVIHYGWRTHHEIDLGYMGFMQAGVLPQTTYPNLKVYMPKVLPITVGARTWDLCTIEDFNTAPTAQIDVSSAYWETPLLPPDRLVEYLCDASNVKKIAFVMGYDITRGIGAIRKDLVNRAWWIYTTRKSYPQGIDDKLGNVPANTWYTAICYRMFFDCENPDKGTATNFYYYELGKDLIVYFDFHSTASFENLKLPAEYVGRFVSVVEKSANITVHTSEVIQDGVTVSMSSGSYGYGVLKIS